MSGRRRYAAAALILLAVEVFIALFVHDAFVRPYGGDILVTVWLCCVLRAVVPGRIPYLPLRVFLFSAAVEGMQAMGIAAWIPASWTVLRVIVGSVFSVWDLVCYTVGCLLFFFAEHLWQVRMRRFGTEIEKIEKDS